MLGSLGARSARLLWHACIPIRRCNDRHLVSGLSVKESRFRFIGKAVENRAEGGGGGLYRVERTVHFEPDGLLTGAVVVRHDGDSSDHRCIF